LGRTARDDAAEALQVEAEASQEAAIERLREIAENGLDDRALDGLDDIDEAAIEIDPSALQGATVRNAPDDGRAEMRIVEALLFAAPLPLSEKKIAEQLPPETDVRGLLEKLATEYAERGVQLVRVAGKWAFRTADDLSYLLEKYAVEERRLSKAALETLAIIAYHQPVTRAEIEEIRGVQTSRGTLDVLMETGWIRPRGRRRAPGKPLTYGTTDEFLNHFGLDGLGDLPGLAELKGAGLLDSNLPPNFEVPNPKDVAALMPDELPLEDEDDADDDAPELKLVADEEEDSERHDEEDEGAKQS
jgi:segregation and condensation protein B